MKTNPTFLLRALCLAVLPLLGTAAQANDFPTSDRVIYVEECMRVHPGAHYEMLNKCSCALDTMARKVKFDDYVTMTTIVNAMSIGGERGGALRDNESVKPQIKRYKDLQVEVQKACFLAPAP